MNAKCLWHPGTSRQKNVYVLFEARFTLHSDDNIMLKVLACDLYSVYVDGNALLEGPARFEKNHPEFDKADVRLEKGCHIITGMVHYYGEPTRMSAGDIPPFFQCELSDSQEIIKLDWRCKEINAYMHTGRRVNGLLGWMEFCDTRYLPEIPDVNSGDEWLEPVEVKLDLGDCFEKTIRDCLVTPINASPKGEGIYANRFGYLNDDPPVRFLMRDLHTDLPAEGVWFRYDLEKIGLYKPQVTLEVPEGTVIEIGYADRLTDGKVYPIISLSDSASCNMDRWIAKGGRQTISTFSYRGFRFMEIHIEAPKDVVSIMEVSAIQRCYYGEPVGMFKCSDSLLNKIWEMSIDTLRACSEDALVDTPVRERGQWLGDQIAVGIENSYIAYGDLSLIRRSLMQAVYCKSQEGVVPGLYPGQLCYLTSYSLLWVKACIRFYHLTGDRRLLEECYETALSTVDVFSKQLTPRGILPPQGVWDFIDWGHIVPDNSINVSLNLLMLGALEAMEAWESILGIVNKDENRKKHIAELENIIQNKYRTTDGLFAHSISTDGNPGELMPGYHATVIGLWLNLFSSDDKEKAVEFVKKHMLDCFPNNLEAPRLAHPSANNPMLITPYFSHFALHALLEASEVDFVLEQYRVCWGWMLEQGYTTALEVFDTRWSLCHAWSGCPAWQLSTHILGLSPDTSGDPYRFMWNPKPGSLEWANGVIPLVEGKGTMIVDWVRKGDTYEYQMHSEHSVEIMLSRKMIESIVVDGEVAGKVPEEYFKCSKLKVVYR